MTYMFAVACTLYMHVVSIIMFETAHMYDCDECLHRDTCTPVRRTCKHRFILDTVTVGLMERMSVLMATTGNASAMASCDFETDLCGWQHVNTSSAMYWRRQRAPAPRLSNGPPYDHTRRSDQGPSTRSLFIYLLYNRTQGTTTLKSKGTIKLIRDITFKRNSSTRK